jgi:hypothetical protein
VKTIKATQAPLNTKTLVTPTDRQSVLVGTRTGGQGKTLILQLLAHAAYLQNCDFNIVSVDSVDDGSSGTPSTSKLGRVLTGVHQIAIAAPLSEVIKTGKSAITHWDGLGELLAEGNCLVDLGANVLPSVFQWAGVSEQGCLFQPMTLIIPVTRQTQSAADAIAVMEEATELRQHFPIQRIVVAFNDVHGKVADDPGPDFIELRKRVQAGRIVECHIDRCDSELWAQIETSQKTFSQLATMTDAEFQIAFNLGRFPAGRGRLHFKRWLDEQVRRLAAIGLPLAADESTEIPAATSGFDS